MNVSFDIAALIAAIVWPAAIVFVLLKYRDLIEKLVNSKRLPTAGIADVLALEFREANEMRTEGPASQDLLTHLRLPRPVSQDIVGRILEALVEQLKDDTPADYVVIDLGNREEKMWLASRLYITALLLQQMTNLQALVFVEATQDTQRRIVGWTEVSKVRWALAQHFGWLEEAFSKAYYEVMSSPKMEIANRVGNLTAVGQPGNVFPAVEIIDGFFGQIQHDQTQCISIPAGTTKDEWVPIGWSWFERAQWLDASSLEKVLGEELITSYVRDDALYGKTSSNQTRVVLSQTGRYVALTRDDKRFEKLIDRREVLENVAHNVLQEV